MTDFVYGEGLRASIVGSGMADPIDFLGNTIHVGLSSSTHVPTEDDEFADDGGADDFVDGELSGTGYARAALASKALTYDAANDRVEWDAADTTYSGIDAGTAAQATILDDTGATDADKRLLANIDSGGFPVVTNGGDLTIQWNAEGIIHGSV